MSDIDMKDAIQKLSTIIIVLVVIKTIDFSNMGLLDYAIILLVAIWMILTIIKWIRRIS